MRMPLTRFRARVGLVVGVTTAVVIGAAAPVLAAAAAMTLSATSGPTAGGNTVTAPTPAATFNASTAIEFQYVGAAAGATCAAVDTAPAAVVVTGTPPTQTAGILAVPAGNVKVLSPTKIAITIPSTVALGGSQVTA